MDEQDQTPVVGPEAPAGASQQRTVFKPRWERVAIPVLIVLLAGVGWQTWSNREELRHTQIELGRRIAEGDSLSAESRALARQLQESMESLQNKIGAVEGKVQQAQGQYAALEGMYAEFSRARDERVLTEIEQAIDIASQQLQLAGNVPAAIAALQSADGRLALLDQARSAAVRKLVGRDIERLKALPLSDITAIALQLDTMMAQVDALPLGYQRSLPGKREEGPVPAVQGGATAGFFKNLLAQVWGEFRQLVRVERLDQPDAALMAPDNAAYLRENVRLRLLSARLALLQRDGKLFSEDVRQARTWLERYFDTQARPVSGIVAELGKIEEARLTMSLPNLEETAMALRNLKLSGNR